jgi:sigma-B regulation protein RsbU (phosphoserine phosphatase)
MEDMKYRAGSMTLEPGDKIFQYTDGVTEATNINNELYGMDRLGKILNEAKNGTPQEILPAVKADIDEFVGAAPQFDDITTLIFDYKPVNRERQVVTKIFPAKTEALSDVLGFVEENLEQRKCSKKKKTSICVAIEEVFVNIAHYAYGGAEGQVSLRIAFEEDSRVITFRIADQGVPFDPLKRKDPDISLSAEEREIGGLGIFLTKKTMDSVTYAYENGENVLTMSKKI